MLVRHRQSSVPARSLAGFTLIELLAAIALLATLLALAVPGYQLYAERARRSQAIGQIGRIDIAINEFAVANTGCRV